VVYGHGKEGCRLAFTARRMRSGVVWALECSAAWGLVGFSPRAVHPFISSLMLAKMPSGSFGGTFVQMICYGRQAM
jgi:hypothetical protein